MKVVVTGGGGYVGYHVGWAIAQGGHEVILVDLVPPDPLWSTTAPEALYDALPHGFWDNDGKGLGDLKFVKASVTSYGSLRRLFEGAKAVIHTASYGISGEEQLNAYETRQEEVNVVGTRTVLMAAVAAKVEALVYTSTYNVVFGGDEIRNGDESLPFYPMHAHSDHYSRTKTIAEMMVLMANGKQLGMEEPFPATSHHSLEPTPLPLSSLPSPSSPPSLSKNIAPPSPSSSPPPSTSEPEGLAEGHYPLTLRTCALRLAGVMGLGERRHSTRVIEALSSGFLCTYGSSMNLVDFVGIQNVVQVHIKAMLSLIKEQNEYLLKKRTMKFPCAETKPTALSENLIAGEGEPDNHQTSGRAFFISDRSPINHFEYFRPWYEGLDYGFPSIALPFTLIMIVAHVQQILYRMVHKIHHFKPFITPAEVYKSGVTHYFSCRRAERSFGYRPTRPNDQKQMVGYFKSKGFVRNPSNPPSFEVHKVMAAIAYIMGIWICLLLG